jgi:indolepyruvate ferredoxin oxidoreductase beta subunit
MKQQIIVSGLGGQGALTVTRLLAEAAAALGKEVITSETHGMAQRGGTVISMVKVGPFRGPLIPLAAADVGIFLYAGNLPVHMPYLKPHGVALVDVAAPGDYRHLDARTLTAAAGLPPVAANLVLLGYGAGLGLLFCEAPFLDNLITAITPSRFRDMNLTAFRLGVAQAAP